MLVFTFLIACGGADPSPALIAAKQEERVMRVPPAAIAPVPALPSLDARRLHEQRSAFVVVDIRDRKYFLRGHVAGAESIPQEELSARLPFFKEHREQQVILIDQAGSLAPSIQQQLEKLHYTNIRALPDGMKAWMRAGLPVVQGGSKTEEE